MERQRVIVSTTELEHAISVWMAVAPARFERELIKQLLLREQKRGGGDPLPAFRSATASWIAAKLAHARWEVTREDRAGPLFG